MKSNERRLRTIYLSLTPQQMVVVGLSEHAEIRGEGSVTRWETALRLSDPV